MYRVYLCYDRLHWAYHRRCVALQKYAPTDFEVGMGVGKKPNFPRQYYDLFLQLCYFHAPHLRKHLDDLNHNSVIVTGFNTGWLNEGPRECRFHFESLSESSDHVIFNNRMAWGLAGKPPDTTWISNGVDRDLFRSITPFREREQKAVWLGSYFHSEPDRDLKNYHSILVPLKKRLESQGIEFDLRRVNSMDSEKGKEPGIEFYNDGEMADWYNSARVYICASNSEGTPNPALEAASCGTTIISPPVGNMPELIEHGLNGLLVEHTIESIENAAKIAIGNYENFAVEMQRTIKGWDWKIRANDYYELFRNLIEAKRKGRDIG